MGESLNPFGGGGKSGSSSSGNFSTPAQGYNLNTVNLDELAGAYENLAGEETGYGTDLSGSGWQQYVAGQTGNLTPAQAAMVNYTTGENNLGTNANFASMGLGGSTMNQQQLEANNLASLAQSSGMMTEDELLGLQAMQQGLGFLNAGGGNLGGAAGIFNNQVTAANTASQANQAQTANALQQLLGGLGQSGSGTTSGTSTGTPSVGNVGSLASLLGGTSGSTASSGAGAVDTGAWDTGLSSLTSDGSSGIASDLGDTFSLA